MDRRDDVSEWDRETSAFAEILVRGGLPDGASLGTALVHAWANEVVETYHTQGGGMVKWDELQKAWVFTEAPSAFPNLKVGDLMPEEWGIA